MPRQGLQLSRNELGRVLDPEGLAAASGARVRVQIEVPAAWLAEPCEIDVVVPRRLVCARCDGGGCDGCGRSGALRAPASGDARTVCVRLSEATGATGVGVAIRIAEPFGAEAAIAQLILEVQQGASASPGVTRRAAALASSPPLALTPRASPWPGLLLVTAALTAAIVLSLLAR